MLGTNYLYVGRTKSYFQQTVNYLIEFQMKHNYRSTIWATSKTLCSTDWCERKRLPKDWRTKKSQLIQTNCSYTKMDAIRIRNVWTCAKFSQKVCVLTKSNVCPFNHAFNPGAILFCPESIASSRGKLQLMAGVIFLSRTLHLVELPYRNKNMVVLLKRNPPRQTFQHDARAVCGPGTKH